MPDSKITALTSIGTSTDPVLDQMVIVDVSDGSMAATGTTKKVTLNNLLACSPTATLASATITGDLTVDTSTLKVDSANNRVGVGTATPTHALDVTSSATTVIRSLASASNQAYVSVAGNGGVVGTSSFDLIQDGSSNAFVYNRANAYLAFGTNNTERLRIDSSGVATWSNVGGVAGTAMVLNSSGVGIGSVNALSGGSRKCLTINSGAGQLSILELAVNGSLTGYLFSNASQTTVASQGATFFSVETNSSERFHIDSSGNVGVGVTPSYRFHAAVATGSNQNIARFQITGASNGLTIKWNNTTSKMIVNFADCPTSPTGLSSGDLWIDTTAGNTLKVA